MPPRSPRHAAFGAAVRRLREQRGLSQERLALDAGMERTYMGGIERGERNLTLKSLEGIAERAGLNPLELLEQGPVPGSGESP